MAQKPEQRTPATQTPPPLPFGPGPGRGGPGIRLPGQRAKNPRQTIARLWGYLSLQRSGLILSSIMVLFSTLLGLAGPYLMGQAIDRYIIPADLSGLARICLIMLAVIGVATLTGWAQSYLAAKVAQRTVRDMRKALFDRLQLLPLRFFDQRTHGELMSRLTNDVDNISQVLNEGLVQLVSGALTFAGTLIIMLVLSWPLALVSLLTIPLMVLITRFISTYTLRDFRAQQEALGQLNGHIEETITGRRVIQAFGREPVVIADFEKSNQRLLAVSVRAQVFSQSIGPMMNLVNNIGYALVAGAGGWMALSGWVTVGTIAAFLNYVQQFTRPLNMLANLVNMLQSALAGAERFFEIVDEAEEMPDIPGAVALDNLRGEVEFEHVTFGYLPDTPVLKDVSLQVRPGQTIALVGPTGAGKTTLINLLSRFYDVDQGAIRIDGHDVRTIKKFDLRSRLGIVLQDTYLFSASVMENIRYGRLDASDEEVMAAARLANADGFIRHLPHGYQTQLSEGASNLSQGQRQLLAIARAVLADPGILILDEATSSVDTRTEKHIQEALLR
ncbi:MAG: ABC transporter ATP-binding protein, partial [Anaerolineae bacterium]|nr:ABC transporter ATP-binding protein [Anaerolineae bacterium]